MVRSRRLRSSTDCALLVPDARGDFAPGRALLSYPPPDRGLRPAFFSDRGLPTVSSSGPGSSSSFSYCDPGILTQPHPRRRGWGDVIPWGQRHSAPCRWRGRAAGLGVVGLSLALASRSSGVGCVLGKVGTVRACPALGNPRLPAAGPPCLEAPLLGSHPSLAPPETQPSGGSQRVPEGGGGPRVHFVHGTGGGHGRVRFCFTSGKRSWDLGVGVGCGEGGGAPLTPHAGSWPPARTRRKRPLPHSRSQDSFSTPSSSPDSQSL